MHAKDALAIANEFNIKSKKPIQVRLIAALEYRIKKQARKGKYYAAIFIKKARPKSFVLNEIKNHFEDLGYSVSYDVGEYEGFVRVSWSNPV
jgi:hypothetical protein